MGRDKCCLLAPVPSDHAYSSCSSLTSWSSDSCAWDESMFLFAVGSGCVGLSSVSHRWFFSEYALGNLIVVNDSWALDFYGHKVVAYATIPFVGRCWRCQNDRFVFEPSLSSMVTVRYGTLMKQYGSSALRRTLYYISSPRRSNCLYPPRVVSYRQIRARFLNTDFRRMQLPQSYSYHFCAVLSRLSTLFVMKAWTLRYRKMRGDTLPDTSAKIGDGKLIAAALGGCFDSTKLNRDTSVDQWNWAL